MTADQSTEDRTSSLHLSGLHSRQGWLSLSQLSLVLVLILPRSCCHPLFDCFVLVLPRRHPSSFVSSSSSLVVCNLLFLSVVYLSSLVVLPHCCPLSLSSSSLVVRRRPRSPASLSSSSLVLRRHCHPASSSSLILPPAFLSSLSSLALVFFVVPPRPCPLSS